MIPCYQGKNNINIYINNYNPLLPRLVGSSVFLEFLPFEVSWYPFQETPLGVGPSYLINEAALTTLIALKGR
jgi:hypothetical protein